MSPRLPKPRKGAARSRSALLPLVKPIGLGPAALGTLIWSKMPIFSSCYQALHDQYLAENLSFAVSHLCLARNDLRLAGWLFLMVILLSPYLTNLTSLPFLASTALFLDLFGVLLGLL
jgi:hypothetical protein